MLRVTIELVPMGNEAHKKLLSVLHIANTVGGSHVRGNYSVIHMSSEKHYGCPPERFSAKGVLRNPDVLGFLQELVTKLVPVRGIDLGEGK